MVGGGALGAVTYLRGGLLPRPPPEGLPVLLGPLAGVLLIGFLHRPGFRVSSTGPGTAAPCCSVVLKVVCGLEVACLHRQKPVRAEPVEALRSASSRSEETGSMAQCIRA